MWTPRPSSAIEPARRRWIGPPAPPHKAPALVDPLIDPIVLVEGLRKSFDTRGEVLSGVHLTILRGERVALIGANGSGKSTLLRCIVGLIPLSAGTVQVMGERFTHAPTVSQRSRLRRRTGFVFQKHGLVRRRSVLSNVVQGMSGQPRGWRAVSQEIAPASWRTRAVEALADVNLSDKIMARADTLSGGQQQRVAIARALVHAPDLLIADEPAASLDPVAGRDVMALFLRLCRESGATLLFTSHDMEHAVEFADRIVALKAGRIWLNTLAHEASRDQLAEVFDDR